MSFSVACDRHDLEYSGSRPPLTRLTLEIARFLRLGSRALDDPRCAEWSLSRYVAEEGYSPRFRDHFLVPLCAALWSTAPSQTLDFPLVYAVRFFANHGILGFRRLRWKTVTGGSQSYVRALEERLRINLSTEVRSIRRLDGGVELRLAGDELRRFDGVVVATHADQALRLLEDPSEDERRLLGVFGTTENDTVLHTDERFLPRRVSTRGSWNYQLRDCGCDDGRPTMTYYLNKLQRLDEDEHYCVTLNRTAEIDPARIIRRFSYRHPLVTLESMRAQPELPRLNGPRRTAFAGAWQGYCFHEDGLRSGLAAAAAFGASLVRSALYTGTVMHARKTPKENVFRYRVCFYLLDLDELPELDRRVRLFGWNRRGLVSLHDRDHLDVRAYLAEHGIEADRILLLTNLRVLGYVFNPVSFFYCYQGGELACIVAEVSNTFGERLPYLLSPENQDTGERRLSYRHDKKLHVSPFFGLDQSYQWWFSEPGEQLDVRIDLSEGGARPFFATLTGKRRPLTSATFARALIRYPLMPLQVTVLIHLQAARLWLKRVPFFHKPPFVPGEGSVKTVTEVLRELPAGRRIGARLAERAAIRALGRVEHGALELRLPGGRVYRAGTGDPIVVTVTSNDVFRRLARSPGLGFGESYAAGDWHTDDLPGLIALVVRNLETWRAGSRLARLDRHRPHLSPRQGLRKARANIQYHYDLGNDLYRLFLDESMTYSCALWQEGDTLEQAQERKLRAICEKLRLRPGDHVLEIGCGWGSFALMAAGEYGARVTGVTLSQQQLELARERVAAAGLADRVEIRLQDYRTLEGQFSKIASIEMLEAIGYAQYPTFFAACDRLLAPGGLAAIQVIGMPDQRFERYRRKEDWIQRYIFPGSLLPSLEALQTAMSRASGLMVVGLEEIGPHYADTLKVVARAVLREPPRGARARLRRPLHPDLGLLPRLLRGAVQDARDPRHAARPRPAVRGARLRDLSVVVTCPDLDTCEPRPGVNAGSSPVGAVPRYAASRLAIGAPGARGSSTTLSSRVAAWRPGDIIARCALRRRSPPAP